MSDVLHLLVMRLFHSYGDINILFVHIKVYSIKYVYDTCVYNYFLLTVKSNLC